MKCCNFYTSLGSDLFANTNQSSEKEIKYFLRTCDPSIYTMDRPDLTVPNFVGNSIGTQRVDIYPLNYCTSTLSIHNINVNMLVIYSKGIEDTDKTYRFPLTFHCYISVKHNVD